MERSDARVAASPGVAYRPLMCPTLRCLATTTLLLVACHRPAADVDLHAPAAEVAAPTPTPEIERDPELAAVDSRDACPDAVENRNGIDDDDGCPEPLPADLTAILGVIDGLRFSINKDTIVAGQEVLTAIAEVLRRYPGVVLEIRGHQAATGERHYRVDLSTRRAHATRKFLVHLGIDPERLIATGYGEEVPIADNRTREGRARNSRIELEVVER